MRVFALSTHLTSGVTEALVRRGWDRVHAEAAARGARHLAFVFEGLSDTIRDEVADASRNQGLECLTGPDWILLMGSISRIAGLTRPGFSSLPDSLAESLGRQLQNLNQPSMVWQTARGPLPLDEPRIVGILNVTPDSFSDGGQFLKPRAALTHAETMIEQGADVIDVGGESTRPGAREVTGEEEWNRIGPVVEELVRRFPKIKISVDTVRSDTARRALDAGAAIINDVSGFRIDPKMATVCAATAAGVVLMHSRGTVGDMASYDHANYGDLMVEICDELEQRCRAAVDAGLPADAVVVDPGLGFSKRPEDNFAILRQLEVVGALGYPVMVGPSRKRFLRGVSGDETEIADDATTAAVTAAFRAGAALFRVHNVARTHAALRVSYEIRGHA